MFKFKPFQRQDYAAAAMHDGVILGHDTGGGKTIALFVWPALKVGFKTDFAPGEIRRLEPSEPVLLVVPGDLHQRTIKEAREKFHIRVTVLDSQAAFLQLTTSNPKTGKRELPPGYYITSYTQLTSNGVTPFPQFQRDNIVGMMQILGLTDRDSSEFFDTRQELYQRHYRRLEALPSMTLAELRLAWQTAKGKYENNETYQAELKNSFHILERLHCDRPNPSFSDLPPEKRQTVRALMTEARYAEYSESIGHGRWLKSKSSSPSSSSPNQFKVKCVYSPSLADLCLDAFGACAVDEGVRMKGEESIIGTGVRQIYSRYKLVLTATPIKNRLPDVFRLAWWATGGRPEAHARFPYPDDSAAREEFAGEFLVSERNLSKEKDKPQRYRKLTPQVCNVHRLWKMFAPIILRRRKKDFGLDIVAKHRHVVRAPLGTEQAAVYRYHLKARYLDKNGAPAIGAQLQALRVAAANPVSELLVRPHGDGTKGDPRGRHSYIPKLHSALKLVHQCLGRGEQAVVFSAFHDSLDVLSARLTEAGVAHCLADGRVSQKRRGVLSAQFELGPGKSPWPVMLAGVECMSEGHSFPLCNNVILLCYSWAYDKFEQAINRIHRINSRWDVNVYPIICERSIDRKLEAMIQEKGDAAELVLDGKLLGEQTTEINLAELLEIARNEFETGGKLVTVDEQELEKEWPPLRSQLAQAAANWRVRGFELLGQDSVIVLPEAKVEPVTNERIVQVQTARRFKPSPKSEAAISAFDTSEDLLLWQLAAN